MAFLEHNAVAYLNKSLLNEKHLVIGTRNLPPYISYANISTDGRIHDASGFINEIVLYLAAKYQFTFDYVSSIDGAYGSFENRSWNGLIGMMHRNELDLVAACLVVNYARSTAVDFSVQFYDDLVSLLIPYPALESSINGITRPFQYEVWILILISISITTIATWKIFSMELSVFGNKEKINKPSFYASFWSLLDFHYTVRRHINNSSRLPFRVIATVWCLATFVLINAYSSTLTACLMTPRYYPMVDSIEDIATISRPVFMVRKSTSYETAIFESKEGTLFKIGETLKKYPELRINATISFDTIVESVISHQRSFTTVKSSLLDTIEKDWEKTGKCRLYLAKKPWDTARVAFALQKSSPLTPILNHQINWLRDVGLLDYWERRNWRKKNRCSEPLAAGKPEGKRRLTFDNLSSAFVLLGCGLVASFVLFLVELVRYRIYGSDKSL